MSKLDELRNKAQQIRTNELPESNTAELIGQTLQIICDLLNTVVDKIVITDEVTYSKLEEEGKVDPNKIYARYEDD